MTQVTMPARVSLGRRLTIQVTEVHVASGAYHLIETSSVLKLRGVDIYLTSGIFLSSRIQQLAGCTRLVFVFDESLGIGLPMFVFESLAIWRAFG
jgi:hypothetical protein